MAQECGTISCGHQDGKGIVPLLWYQEPSTQSEGLVVGIAFNGQFRQRNVP